MSQTASSKSKTKKGDDRAVYSAKTDVSSSVNRLETALDHVAAKVEESAHKVQHYKDLAQKPQEMAQEVKARALIVKDQAMVYVDKVRANPTPFVMILGLIATAFWIRYTAKEVPADASLF